MHQVTNLSSFQMVYAELNSSHSFIPRSHVCSHACQRLCYQCWNPSMKHLKWLHHSQLINFSVTFRNSIKDKQTETEKSCYWEKKKMKLAWPGSTCGWQGDGQRFFAVIVLRFQSPLDEGVDPKQQFLIPWRNQSKSMSFPLFSQIVLWRNFYGSWGFARWENGRKWSIECVWLVVLEGSLGHWEKMIEWLVRGNLKVWISHAQDGGNFGWEAWWSSFLWNGM